MEQTLLKDLNDEFAGFTGTENYYKHWLPDFFFTDGIKTAVTKFAAYWLLDVVFSYQTKPNVSGEKFQIWTITVEDKKATVEMRSDADQPVLIRQQIPFTTFPEGLFKMYYIDDGSYKVLLLPSEY
ncbi:MAG: hypothetical protein P9M03_09620 [Candidatus Theseobacter exili]|nr:hypothetical protein [Candidatus Theseobacter exili]